MGQAVDEHTFKQLVDIQQIKNLLQAQVSITGLPCGLMDNDGNILAGIGLNDVCARFHWTNKKTFARCWRNEPDISEQLRTFTGEPLDCCCKNGMVHLVMPIVIAGRYLAVFFSGQFFFDAAPPDLDWFWRHAEETGLDTESYLGEVYQVPSFSRGHVKNTLHFLHRLVQVLAETGHANLLRLSDLERQRQTEWELLILNRAVDASSEALFLMDSQGRFVYVNDAACCSLGYARDELLNMTPLDIDPDEHSNTVGRRPHRHSRRIGVIAR